MHDATGMGANRRQARKLPVRIAVDGQLLAVHRDYGAFAGAYLLQRIQPLGGEAVGHEPAGYVQILDDKVLGGGQHSQAARPEQVGRGILPAQHQIRNDPPGGRAQRDAGSVEAGGDIEVLRAGNLANVR